MEASQLPAGICPAVILASGSSSRLGYPKQGVRLSDAPGSETLLERAIGVAIEAGLRPVYVVARTPDGLERATSRQPAGNVIWVANEQASEGMAASIRLGVQSVERAVHDGLLPNRTGLVIMACDQPATTAAHLRQLASMGFCSVGAQTSTDAENLARAVASAYAGRKGVPAFFPHSSFATLCKLTGDMGARNVLAGAEAIPLHHGEVDIDTEEDLALARQLFT